MDISAFAGKSEGLKPGAGAASMARGAVLSIRSPVNGANRGRSISQAQEYCFKIEVLEPLPYGKKGNF
jgi:hypothetical protein